MSNEDYLLQFEQTRETRVQTLIRISKIVFATTPRRTKAPAPKLQTHVLAILSIISLSFFLVHFRGRLPLSRSSQIPIASRGPEMLQDSSFPWKQYSCGCSIKYRSFVTSGSTNSLTSIDFCCNRELL